MKPNRRIGGSDIGKLLGLSKYGNAADVYLRIVEGVDDEWNPRMERGAAVEPVLRAHAQRAMGLELEDSASDVHAHPGNDFAWAQVDDIARWQGMPVAVDYKSQSAFAKGWGAPGSADVPESIAAQVAWELACTGRELGLVVVGFGTDAPAPDIFHVHNVVHYEIERDHQFEALCLQVAREFWEGCVIPRRPPSVKPLGKKQAKAS